MKKSKARLEDKLSLEILEDNGLDASQITSLKFST
jgi:hypothetical protein